MSFRWNQLEPAQASLLKAHGGEAVVVIRPALVMALKGNGNAAILLSQLLYWSAKTDEANGWFHNTQDRFYEQTGLGSGAQKSARDLLEKLGLIEQVKVGWPSILHIRVNLAAVAQLLASHSVSDHMPKQESDHMPKQTSAHVPKQSSDHAPKLYKESKTTTETTTEIESTHARALVKKSFSGIAEEIWKAYPKRVEKPDALKEIIGALERLTAGKDAPEDFELWPPPDVGQWLLERTRRYAQVRETQESKFTPYPQRWFRKSRYSEDEANWLDQKNFGNDNGTNRNYNQAQPHSQSYESAAQRRERKLRGLLSEISGDDPPASVQHADGFSSRALFLN